MMIPNAFVSTLTTLLGNLAADEVGMLLGVPGEIQKLDLTLRDISQVLADAESKRVAYEDINKWLVDLKDVMYDADDILDELEIAAVMKSSRFHLGRRPWSSSPPPPTSSVCCRFPDRFCSCLWSYFPNLLSFFCNPVLTRHIGTRIRDLNHRLDEVSARKSRLDLLKLPPGGGRENSGPSGSGSSSRHTSSLMEPDIVGTKIDEDTQAVSEWLTREDDRDALLVYAIVGMGGIGKTTLAQKIFNDQRIKNSFSITMWACVSQEFSSEKLLKDIIRSAGGEYGRDDGRILLEPILERCVRGKKFLLVLDDVWNVKVWDDLLRKPLSSGGAGSRILITTRNEDAAGNMKAVEIHYVGLLPPEDGWSLLCRVVVLKGEEREIEYLKDTGMKIVEKCGYLPLAIKVIGGVLRIKNRSRRAWEELLRSTAWSVTGLPEGIHEALYLSYEDLPSHLKQCFLFCSLFPEDYEIIKEKLVRLWIAEGFVQGISSTMEDSGEDHYRELVSRNLLHINRISGPLHRDQQDKCTMHDLLRSLAQFLSRDECLVFEPAAVQEFGDQEDNRMMKQQPRRHLSIVGDGTVTIPDGMTSSLRTLLLFKPSMGKSGFDLVDTFKKFLCLRLLDLSKSSTAELPNSIGGLVHLRYLNLGRTKIKAIPESIGNLRNLQFLFLEFCYSLTGLPKGVANLRKLRCLDLTNTGIDGIPLGLGKLQQLNRLHGFKLHPNSSKGSWCTLEELRPLTQLRDLTITKLEYASTTTSSTGILVNMPNLVFLSLEAGSSTVNGEEAAATMKRFEEVFEDLCPPSCVETLFMHGFYGHRFPSWISGLFNLTRLSLVNCKYCEQLPPLGQLPHLESLTIQSAQTVTSIGAEFMGGNSRSGGGTTATLHPCPSFPKLKELTMKDMPNLEEWTWEGEAVAMPRLEELVLATCSKLSSLPRGLLRDATALTRLEIVGAGSLRAVENHHSIRCLILHNCRQMERISDLPALAELTVSACPGLQVVCNLGKQMEFVKWDGESMELLPDLSSGGIEMTEDRKLRIIGNDQ